MYLIAKCRTGSVCRYHGRSVESPAVIDALPLIDHELICPEMLAGLPCPRPPIKIRGGRYYLDNVTDITDELEGICGALADTAVDKGVDMLIGVSGSPTCDPKTGCFAKALAERGIKTVLSLPRSACR